ncbi:MAG: iduronate-2-sulfatase [Rhodopirellula sp.]|nr:iduronate-2-sulfatase [Rhodopirellula sp.]OUX51052.1 MAG: iduronate-2-sulfatase [Rhodopirellula sp. TMED283]
MPKKLKTTIGLELFPYVLVLALNAVSPAFGQTSPNILFIAIDDLRPELGCYGSPIAKSPHIDRLASEGLRFNRAYCQQAICSPSRASLMTGARPDTIGVIENTAYFRELNPNIVTLPQHLIANGYETAYCGKIYHAKMTDNERSWSRKPAWKFCQYERPELPGSYALPENQKTWLENKQAMLAKYGPGGSGGLVHGPAYEAADVEDHVYRDGFNTQLAIATLQDHLKHKPEQPLFLALGLVKPHLDFIAPKKYWDLYDRSKIKIASQASPPEGGAATGLHASFELRTRHGIPKSGPIDEELARTLLHGYYACVSYVDAQVGMMLKALQDAGVRDNTIVIVWGDHGWHLGDMGIWGKATNYEIATRVPMVIWTPDMKVRGATTDALVELVDIYPTLCDLSGISLPEHLEGQSFAPLLTEPSQPWKTAAFSQFPNPALREWAANPLSAGMRQTFFGPLIRDVETRIIKQQGDRWDRDLFENHLMGYTMRTDRYRLVLWCDYRDPDQPPVFVELYDHQNDPRETFNVAMENPQIVERLTRQFKQGWQATR